MQPNVDVASSEVKLQGISASHTSFLFYLGLALITIAGFWLRLAWIDHPMRYDEAFTTLQFVASGRWFNYEEPNNHILNTLLMQLSVWIWGFSPGILRLPAFIFGVLAIPATSWCANVLSERKIAGLIAAGFVATSSVMVEYSTNARGYSLLCLATLIIITLSIRLAKAPEGRRFWWFLGIAAVAGLYSIPVMLPAVLLATLLMLAAGRARFRNLFPRLATTLLLVSIAVIILYLPVAKASGWKALFSNRWIKPEPIELLPGNLLGLSRDLVDISTTDMPLFAKGMLLLGLVGIFAAGFQRRNKVWLLPILTLFVVFLFPILQRRVPPARADIYLVPLLFVVSSAGLICWSDFLKRGAQRRNAVTILLALAICAWTATAWECQKRDFLILKEPWECVDAETIVNFAMINRLTSLPNVSIPSNSVSATFIYYSLLHPQFNGMQRTSIADNRSERVYLFLWKEDSVRDFYVETPYLEKLYNPPEHIRTFASTAVFVCRRKS